MFLTKLLIFGCIIMVIGSISMHNIAALFASIVALCGWITVYSLEN